MITDALVEARLWRAQIMRETALLYIKDRRLADYKRLMEKAKQLEAQARKEIERCKTTANNT